MAGYISPISMEAISNLCDELGNNNTIDPHNFEKFEVKRGLRNADGTGVMAGLTRICSVEGYYILDGEVIPKEGKLSYRGYDIKDIIESCIEDNRYGFEEGAWLLIFGSLPTYSQLDSLREVIGECRKLPDDFVEDLIMKHPSNDIMNKMARSVMLGNALPVLEAKYGPTQKMLIPVVLKKTAEIVERLVPDAERGKIIEGIKWF